MHVVSQIESRFSEVLASFFSYSAVFWKLSLHIYILKENTLPDANHLKLKLN